jgi:hypothetical protein
MPYNITTQNTKFLLENLNQFCEIWYEYAYTTKLWETTFLILVNFMSFRDWGGTIAT